MNTKVNNIRCESPLNELLLGDWGADVIGVLTGEYYGNGQSPGQWHKPSTTSLMWVMVCHSFIVTCDGAPNSAFELSLFVNQQCWRRPKGHPNGDLAGYHPSNPLPWTGLLTVNDGGWLTHAEI